MSTSSLGPGGEFGDYTIDSLLGRGGMSIVFLAEDRRLGRRVAIKVLAEELAEDESFRTRFIRESQLAAGLEHPNIVPVYEAGELDGRLFIAMRYVRGTDLRTLISREGPLDPDRALSLLRPIATALDTAHRRGLVHRDVKPANILVAIDEGEEHPYLSDFGLTKHTSSKSGLTKTGQFMGTVDFVAPEQIRGEEVDGRTDEYSLACVLYQCLTGDVPFDKPADVATMFGHLQDPPPKVSVKRPNLPLEIDDIVVRGMSKERDDRFPTCTAMMEELTRAIGVSSLPRDQPSFDPAVVAMPPQPGTGPLLPPAPEVPSVTPTTAAPTTPAPSPSPSPEPERRPAGGPSRRVLLIGGSAAAVVAAVAIVVLSLGGGEETAPSPSAPTGTTSPGGIFSNDEPIAIRDEGIATPYPSTIEVSGLSAKITDLDVSIRGLSHGFPRDVDLVLVGPSGQTVFLMEGTGGSDVVSDVALTFDDDADPVPVEGALTSGRYRPTSSAGDGFGFNGPPPIPEPPYGDTLAGFNGTDPNGTWSMFLFDDSSGSGGEVADGWTLAIGAASGATGATGSSGVTGTTGGEVIFADDFSDTGSGWDVSQDQRSSLGYRDGTYVIAVDAGFRTTGDFNTSTPELASLSDVRVEANATLLTDSRDALYGVVCRAETPLDYYYFLVGGNEKYFIGKSTEDGGAVNFDIGVTPAVNKGQATNLVTAECEGGARGSPVTLRMFVNGVAVNTLIDEDRPIASGAGGFLVESGDTDTEVAFDDYVVTGL